MKKSIDRITMIILLVFTIISLGIVGMTLFGSYETAAVMEIGINMTAVLLAFIISCINLSEKSWDSAEKRSFDMLLIVISGLITVCMVEDYLYSIEQYTAASRIEIIETICNIALFYLVWIYIANTIDAQEKQIKMMDRYLIPTHLLAMAILIIFGVIVEGHTAIAYYSSLVLALIDAVIFTSLIRKSKCTKIEKASLIILAISPFVSCILYYFVIDLYIQYSIDIMALLICFVNVLFSRGKREESDREFAARVQTSVLPKNFKISDKVEIFAQSRAMEQVGGDFYDFRVIDDNHIAIMMSDVSGHGAPASMFMMQGISLFRGLIMNYKSQTEVMQDLNDILCEYDDEELFITSWFGILDTSTGELQYIDAGHGMAAVVSKDGTASAIKGTIGPVLSAMEGITYKLNTTTINEGDTIFLFTDGIVEAFNKQGEQYGPERLDAVLEKPYGSCEELCNNVYNDVRKFSEYGPQDDDITVMAVKYK